MTAVRRVDDLVAFLHDRLDERAAKAQAACHGGEGRWHQDDAERYPGRIVDEQGNVVVFDEGSPSEEQAAHIVANDPASALADIEAKRKLLDDHPIVPETYPRPTVGGKEVGGPYFPFGCENCHAEHDTGEVHGFGYCLTWKALALPDAGHPEYRPEWRP